jgi:CheY-like chemotaxis protein
LLDAARFLSPDERRAVSAAQDGPLHGVSVLVVDDNADTRNMLGDYLRHFGAHVATLRSGAEALQHLATVRVHVLVIDYTMPGMSGFELLALIRKLPGEAERPTPAILFTAVDGIRAAAQAAGFAAYLVKPLDPRLLVETITALVRV